jgi:beta-galactosidase
MRDSPALSGEMLWAGIDYLGEGIGGSISQGFGLFDRTIEPRLRAFERQAWWTSAPMVKIGRTADLPNARGRGERGGGQVMDWTPASTDPHEETVLVQSNCEEVELLLNGESLGSQKRPADWAPRSWKVPFQPGSLKAVAKNGGREVATDELRSAGKAVRIQLTVDQPTLSPAWDDVAIVRAQLVDDHGVVNPNDSAKITFKTDGPALLAAVDNADLDSFEKFRGNERSTWRGKCIAIIKATGPGKITVSAAAQGLEPGTATLDGVAH